MGRQILRPGYKWWWNFLPQQIWSIFEPIFLYFCFGRCYIWTEIFLYWWKTIMLYHILLIVLQQIMKKQPEMIEITTSFWYRMMLHFQKNDKALCPNSIKVWIEKLEFDTTWQPSISLFPFSTILLVHSSILESLFNCNSAQIRKIWN